jgi:hypothetical protein
MDIRIQQFLGGVVAVYLPAAAAKMSIKTAAELHLCQGPHRSGIALSIVRKSTFSYRAIPWVHVYNSRTGRGQDWERWDGTAYWGPDLNTASLSHQRQHPH